MQAASWSVALGYNGDSNTTGALGEISLLLEDTEEVIAAVVHLDLLVR
jgi:hypothetical protein